MSIRECKTFCKNLFIRALFLFLRKKRPLPSSWTKTRVLIISTTALGDTLWAMPAIRALKTAYPEASISALSSFVGCQVLENQPEIDEIYLLPKKLVFAFPSLLKKLRQKQFDAVLIFHASQRLVFLLGASLGSAIVVGTKGQNKGLDAFLDQAIPWGKSHEIERRLDIVQALGAKKTSYALSYKTKKEEEEFAEEFFQKHHLPLGKTVALHPGAKDFYKCWDKEKFIELGKLLQKKQIPLLITGTKEEKDLISYIAGEIPGALGLTTPLTLRQFAAVLQKTTLVISNDTGPMHLAIALGVPVIGLFAPTDPAICGPFHAKNAHLIAKPRTCTPCLRRKCRYPFCLLQISPEEVFTQAMKILS